MLSASWEASAQHLEPVAKKKKKKYDYHVNYKFYQ